MYRFSVELCNYTKNISILFIYSSPAILRRVASLACSQLHASRWIAIYVFFVCPGTWRIASMWRSCATWQWVQWDIDDPHTRLSADTFYHFLSVQALCVFPSMWPWTCVFWQDWLRSRWLIVMFKQMYTRVSGFIFFARAYAGPETCA